MSTKLRAIQQLAARASSLESIDREQRPIAAVRIGEDLESQLAKVGVLLEVSRTFARLAKKLGCDRIMGASALGERLAGATLAVGKNGLALHQPSDPGRHVLVVDGFLATGTSAVAACESARLHGAKGVSAAVVVAVTRPASLLEVVDEFVVLND